MSFDRFMQKIEVGQKETDCWTWIGAKQQYYGNFWFENKVQLSHRVSYQLFVGSIPEGQNVLHKCDNGFCVNPEHLFLGTQLDNVRDMAIKGRASFGNRGTSKGQRNGGSKLSENEVLEIRKLLTQNWLSHREIAEMFEVSRSNIGLIAQRKAWSHI